ncbi:MAG: heme-binding protein [Cellvibrionales bacterium]|nr:heme-binding protein [Cellvibrionales bacterium]
MDLYCPPLVSHQFALKLVAKATDLALKEHLAVVSCVLDTTGRVKAKLAMDGVPLIAETLVEQKANTALLSISSGDFGEAVEANAAHRESFSSLDDITLLSGGFPLFKEGQLVGAFAVAGALPEQDAEIAQCAMQALKEE